VVVKCEFQGGPVDGDVREVEYPLPDFMEILGYVPPLPPFDSNDLPVAKDIHVRTYRYKRWEVRSRDLIGPDIWRSEFVYVVSGQNPRT
jgi:hypothetical protein